MSAAMVERDERTVQVENASYRLGYFFLAYGLLAVTAWRGLVRGEQLWEPLVLVIVGGGLTSFYQGAHRILHRRWAVLSLISVAVAVGLAIALELARD